jgi:arylsulfatase A-like enzyme
MRSARRILLGAVLAAGLGVPVRAEQEVVVPAQQAWTDTGVDVQGFGRPIRIRASGRAGVVSLKLKERLLGFDFDQHVGPEGTYAWPQHYWDRGRWTLQTATFPVSSGVEGPAPAFGLIGKIGADGRPFYVGREYVGVPDRSGRLWLGVNDYDVRDNAGEFRARIERDVDASAAAPAARPTVQPDGDARPRRGARVLLLYVDGLRPDVVHEMSAQGFLPTITATFLDGGLDCANAFTTFTSNTLVANGTLFTGLFPDRTGIKSQNQFERTTLMPRGQLSEWMPDWLVSRLTPGGPRIFDLLDKFAPENTYRFLRQRGIMTLGNYVGAPHYRSTILPITPMNPPPRWLHRALNTLRNPFKATLHIPHQLDAINARYVTEELLGDADAKVIAAWFPMVDKVSHHSARGQYGAARRELALFDRSLATILARLRQIGWDRSTYLILVSDHGHTGGEERPVRSCNLARDLFHRQLGCNVRVVGTRWELPGSRPDRFVFLDHQAWSQASIYLPKASYHHGPWQRNTLAELLAYDLGPNRGRVDLLETISQFRGSAWTTGQPRPIEVVLVKVDAGRVLVYRSPESQAFITWQRDADGVERFRYQPMRRIRVDAQGQVAHEAAHPDEDPFGWLRDAAFRAATEPTPAWLAQPHTAQEWLEATAPTRYPDAVVGIATFFGWQPPMQDLAESRDPDLLVTAAPGWTFRTDGELGTDHGSLAREAMRISLFLAGPGIRPGVWTRPQRIADVTPTILDMAGIAYDASFLDGRAIRGIYATE